MKIVKTKRNHLEEILILEKECFREDAWSKEGFLSELSNKSAVYITAVDENERVIGYAGCRMLYDEAELVNLCVSPESRRLGVAKEIMSYYTSLWKLSDINCVYLEVRVNNLAAINLYTQFGFEKMYIRKGYYSNNEDAYVMKLNMNKKQNI